MYGNIDNFALYKFVLCSVVAWGYGGGFDDWGYGYDGGYGGGGYDQGYGGGYGPPMRGGRGGGGGVSVSFFLWSVNGLY